MLKEMLSMFFADSPTLDAELLTDFRISFAKEFSNKCTVVPSVNCFIVQLPNSDRLYIYDCNDVFHVSDGGETIDELGGESILPKIQELAKDFTGIIFDGETHEFYTVAKRHTAIISARKLVSFLTFVREKLCKDKAY